MSARNPMSPWSHCGTHNVPFRDADGCPYCTGAVAAVAVREPWWSRLLRWFQ